MPYPGPWVQGPDFTTGFVYGNSGHVAPGAAHVGAASDSKSRPDGTGYIPWTEAELTDVAVHASDAAPDIGAGHPIEAGVIVRWGYDRPSGLSGPYYHWIEATHDFGYLVIRPTAQPGNPVFDDFPANAIAVEWEGEHTLLAAALGEDTELRASATESGTLSPNEPGITFATDLVVTVPQAALTLDDFDRVTYAGTTMDMNNVSLLGVWASVPPADSDSLRIRTLESDVDLMPYVELMPYLGGDDRLVLFTVTRSDVELTGTQTLSNGIQGAMSQSYGWLLEEVRLVRTWQPSRHRFIFEGDPYRRITNRKDGLAGGARRVGQNPKTIQGSNRRGPGAIV